MVVKRLLVFAKDDLVIPGYLPAEILKTEMKERETSLSSWRRSKRSISVMSLMHIRIIKKPPGYSVFRKQPYGASESFLVCKS